MCGVGPCPVQVRRHDRRMGMSREQLKVYTRKNGEEPVVLKDGVTRMRRELHENSNLEWTSCKRISYEASECLSTTLTLIINWYDTGSFHLGMYSTFTLYCGNQPKDQIYSEFRPG